MKAQEPTTCKTSIQEKSSVKSNEKTKTKQRIPHKRAVPQELIRLQWLDVLSFDRGMLDHLFQRRVTIHLGQWLSEDWRDPSRLLRGIRAWNDLSVAGL